MFLITHPLQYFSRKKSCLMLRKNIVEVSISGRNITSLRFADGIDALAEEEQKLEAPVESIENSKKKKKTAKGIRGRSVLRRQN